MEDISEAENGDEEEMYPNNNVQVREKENHQRCRPKSPIAQNYVKTRGGYIKIKKKLYRTTRHMVKLQGTFGKLE